jgi:HEPN domain-containing protein
LSAILLNRSKNREHTLTNICYLLHQSLEKWLKFYLTDNASGYERNHNLFKLLKAASEVDVRFEEILSRLDIEARATLKDNFASNDLRYAEIPPEIEIYISELLVALVEVRKWVKLSVKSSSAINREEVA